MRHCSLNLFLLLLSKFGYNPSYLPHVNKFKNSYCFLSCILFIAAASHVSRSSCAKEAMNDFPGSWNDRLQMKQTKLLVNLCFGSCSFDLAKGFADSFSLCPFHSIELIILGRQALINQRLCPFAYFIALLRSKAERKDKSLQRDFRFFKICRLTADTKRSYEVLDESKAHWYNSPNQRFWIQDTLEYKGSKVCSLVAQYYYRPGEQIYNLPTPTMNKTPTAGETLIIRASTSFEWFQYDEGKSHGHTSWFHSCSFHINLSLNLCRPAHYSL